MTSYSLALREIDTVQDEGQYVPNALDVVVRKVRYAAARGRGRQDVWFGVCGFGKGGGKRPLAWL